MKIKGWSEYFKDKWNLNDFITFFLFLAYYAIRVVNPDKATILYLMKDYKEIHEDNDKTGSHLVTELDKALMVLNCLIVLFGLVKLM